MNEKPMRFARATHIAGGLVLLLALGPGASGQSLGEAARKEKERREKAGPTGPAFTDDDLRGYAGGGAGDEAYWRGRAKAARAAVAAAEARVAQAEAAAQGTPAGIRQPQPGDA